MLTTKHTYFLNGLYAMCLNDNLKKKQLDMSTKITPKIKSADKNNNKKHVVLVVT